MSSEDSESYSVDSLIEFIDEAPQNASDADPHEPSPSRTSSVDWLYWFEDDASNASENPPA